MTELGTRPAAAAIAAANRIATAEGVSGAAVDQDVRCAEAGRAAAESALVN